MDISVIIPTKDRGIIFDETLRSAITALKGISAEIIVVNDSKTSVPSIPDDADIVTLINNPKAGVASARNLGASKASGTTLIFMDDDFLIPPNSLTKVISDSEDEPTKIHLYNWIYPPELEKQLPQTQFGRYLSHYGFTTVKGWMGGEWVDHQDVFELKNGASYFLPIKKTLFDRIGGYDESFPHAGAEDYDFIQRAKKQGVRFYLDKTLTLYHNERDKLDYINWMERKKRNGETIRIAVDAGHPELKFTYPAGKKIALDILSHTKPMLIAMTRMIPNNTVLDAIYFKITNVLLAVYLFEGYTKGKKRGLS